jgi:hypothetical protein
MAQRKNTLYDTASIAGRLSQEAIVAIAEGKPLVRSKLRQREGLNWSQATHNASALLREINLATGRETDTQGAHFHIWDAKKTSDIVLKLRAFLIGMEQALNKTENKQRAKMHKELYKAAQAEVNDIWNTSGVDYRNPESTWESCPIPFESCPKSLKANKATRPK